MPLSDLKSLEKVSSCHRKTWKGVITEFPDKNIFLATATACYRCCSLLQVLQLTTGVTACYRCYSLLQVLQLATGATACCSSNYDIRFLEYPCYCLLHVLQLATSQNYDKVKKFLEGRRVIQSGFCWVFSTLFPLLCTWIYHHMI